MKRDNFLLKVCCIVFILTPLAVTAQPMRDIRRAEDSLARVFFVLKHAQDDSSRTALNRIFEGLLTGTVMLPAAETYPFDSLRGLVKIVAPDGKFRIFQWNLPFSDGSYRYFGLIRMAGPEQITVFPLHDISETLASPDTEVLTGPSWYGALYYQVIPGKTASGEDIYTLLGWSGRNQAITRKLIEVLSFEPDGRPRFGMNIFQGYREGTCSRVIFTYSANATMSMKYEKQTAEQQGPWNPKKRTFDRKVSEAMMIVCERMVPLGSGMEGQYEYYVPAGDLFDGFLFRNGRWVFMPGIDPVRKK